MFSDFSLDKKENKIEDSLEIESYKDNKIYKKIDFKQIIIIFFKNYNYYI
jgi:hypothetical protein